MPKLVVRDSQRTILVDLDVDEAVVLGRSESCDVPVKAARASRRHLAIEPREDGAGHQVRDLDSTNGTLVGGVRVQVPTPLSDGDRVELGDCTIEYFREP